ncbi:MAG: DUF4349 domain-containing protein [Spirochaetaceae bacterium]|jgi:hypothetical protein|nr:DUF4349 domain-containing protein [Spirochaetaceae bacterium]
MKNHGFVLLLAAALILAACAKGAGASGYAPAAYAGAAASKAADSNGGSPERQTAGLAADSGEIPGETVPLTRKLVRNAGINLRVQDPEAADGPLEAAMEKYGAYASSKRIFENSRHYTIRVPSASFEPFFAELSGMGKVLQQSESAEDVTIRFYDLEGRLATKRELLKTFQNYLEKAKDVDEIMTVEQRIAELQQEIDWTGTELRSLADLVDYSTIELTLAGPAASAAGPDLGDRLGNLLGNFGNFVSTALLVLLGVIVYGIPSILILAVLFWLLLGRVGLLKRLWALTAGREIHKTGKIHHNEEAPHE